MNYKLLIQYDGTDFHGWQAQEGFRTVQGELERALSLLEGKNVNVYGSGRTDAGVHAEGQVASVVLQREITTQKLRAAINGNIDKEVRVLDVETAADEFHARYSALGKTYVYRLVNAPVMSPFWSRYAYHEAHPFDLTRMQAAAELFLGRHDWTAFSAAQSDVEDRVRTITQLDVSEGFDDRSRSRLIEIKVSAEGFLRYMVRSIAGALLAAARGELGPAEIQRAIETGARPLSIATAPAHGLTLLSVKYPD